MKTLAITIFFAALSATSFAQDNNNDAIEYRVVAVNAQDENVTSTSNQVELYNPLAIYLPTAFSPNNDGVNDSFGAVGNGIEDYELQIFNRWGNKVFESNDIDNKWDGSDNGDDAEVGTYTYMVVAAGKEFGKVNKSGFVTLVK